jgi:hypothetical protein
MLRRAAIISLGLFLLAGCGSGSGGDGGGPATVSSTVGPAGGVVEAEGVRMEIPAGALDEPVTFEISVTDTLPESLPKTWAGLSKIVDIRPSGTIFKEPATITLPWDPSLRPADHAEETVFVYAAPSAEGPWEPVATVVEESSLVATIHHLTAHTGASGCSPLGHGCDILLGIHCCRPQFCEAGVCRTCGAKGETIPSSGSCCDPLKMIDNVCSNCVPLEGSCGHGFHCCGISSMACLSGHCAPCVKADAACSTTFDCCGSLKCVDKHCQEACGEDGQTCTSDRDCCGGSDDKKCVGGVCADCPKAGESCTDSSGCCKGVFCDFEHVCESCRPEGDPCNTVRACCGGFCEGSTCRGCLREASPCRGADDCCTGSCDDHLCAACPEKGISCGSDGDCCPGDCCKDLPNRNCWEERCDDCISDEGGACGKNGICCGDMQCEDGTCIACKVIGQGCNPTLGDPCCGNATLCLNEVCEACALTDEACGPYKPCCVSEDCPVTGICGKCIETGDPCEKSPDCCSGDCYKGLCFECGSNKEPCSVEAPCCSPNLECQGGICELSCGPPGAACGGAGDLPCCPAKICMPDGTCQIKCQEVGEECGDDFILCCGDLECEGGFCDHFTGGVLPPKGVICDVAWAHFDKCAMTGASPTQYITDCLAWYELQKATLPDDCFYALMNYHYCTYKLSCEDYNAGAAACAAAKAANPAGCPPI